MAQISLRKIHGDHWQKMSKRLLDLMSEEMSDKEVEVLLNGLLTETERVMLVKRLMVWVLINSGWSVPKVCEVLKLSTATVYKFKVWFESNKELDEILSRLLPGKVSAPGRKSSVDELLDKMWEFLMYPYKVRYPKKRN